MTTPINPLSQLQIQQTGTSWTGRKFAPLQQGPVKTWRTTAFSDAVLAEIKSLDSQTGLPDDFTNFEPDNDLISVALFVHDVPAHLSGVSRYLKPFETGGADLASFVSSLNSMFTALTGIATVAPVGTFTPIPLAVPKLEIPNFYANAEFTNALQYVDFFTVPSIATTVYGAPVNLIFPNALLAGPITAFPCAYRGAPVSDFGSQFNAKSEQAKVSCVTQAAVVEGVGASQLLNLPPLAPSPTTPEYAPIIIRSTDLTDAIIENGMEFEISSSLTSTIYVVVGVWAQVPTPP